MPKPENPVKHPQWSFSAKIANGLKTLTISTKKLHDADSKWIPNVPTIGGSASVGVGRLQVFGICSHRLLYKEVVKAWSNYKKSYLWWFTNSTCGDSTASNHIEKDQVCIPPGLVWGKEEKGGVN